MAYLTEDEIKAFATDPSRRTAAINRLAKSLTESAVETTVFLSHSHEDADLIHAAQNLLASEGVYLYVDWKDETMPAVTSAATGVALKDRIARCQKFVVLASNRALDSRWVPWELGYADGIKDDRHIAVLPASNRAGRWEGAEYMGAYAKIKLAASGRIAVFPPGSDTGITLAAWLKR